MEVAFIQVIAFLVRFLEAVGVIVMLAGFALATYQWMVKYHHLTTHEAYLDFRHRSVRGLILGLEFLVAADIIKTITIDPTIKSVTILGLVVLVRTFLVFALHLEIEGRLPWQSPPEDTAKQ